jgi:hypothetical protein
MTALPEPAAPLLEQSTDDAATRTVGASTKAMDFMFGAQRIILEEIVFAGNESLDRARTETHLAGSHSVKDLKTMWQECASIRSTLSAATVSGCSSMVNG